MTASTEIPDEAGRLEALGRYAVLDTAPEPAFDDLTELAAFVCATPTALLTLVDERRQWFKSRVAFQTTETPRDIAFCATTIAQRSVLVIPDALLDPRFAHNPLVTKPPEIRFYAGAPLITSDGYAIGSLAVLDYQPRTPTPEQIDALVRLSRQAMAMLELRRAGRQDRVKLAERFELVSRATNDAVWDWDLVAGTVWWSRGYSQLFGYDPAATPPGIESWTSHLHPDDVDRVRRGIYDAIDRGDATWSDEYRFQRADGSYAKVFDRGYVLHQGGKAVRMIGAMMDISDRRRLEEELRQTQKLDAIGQLSGGIAHDFNNLLTVIQCNATLAHDAAIKPDVRHLAEEILEASERAANLTRQLLVLSRKQVMLIAAVDVASIIAQLSRMFRRVVGEHITIEERCAPSLPAVRGDSSMIEQVLLNLVVNARDAMPRGGELTISTGEDHVSRDRLVHGVTVPAGRYVWIEVRDTGTGIAPDVLPHIFEPFFTTKEVGKGTGLGLATAYGIIRQHRGWIDVESTAGSGTAIRFYLPATDERPARKNARRASTLPTGTETLLVVEDDPAVRRLADHLLASCGYVVHAVADGPCALETWAKQRGRIDLLLTDLVMPGGMTGRELATRLRVDHPTLPVIYMSGYSPELQSDGEELVPGVNFLQKPYPSAALAELVRERLDRARRR